MRRHAIAAAALVLAAPSAFGQQENVNVQQFNPDAGDVKNFAQVSGAGVLDHLQPSLGLYLNYGYLPLQISANDGSWSAGLLEHQVQADVMGAIGFGNRVQLGLALPVTLFQTAGSVVNNPSFTIPTLSSVALGDLRLVPRLRLMGDGSGTDVAIEGVLSLPTGDKDNLQGNGSPTFEPRAMLEFRPAESLRVGLNLGYILRSDRLLYNTNIGNELTYGAGLAYDVTPEKFTLLLEAFGRVAVDGQSELKGSTSPAAAHVAGRFFLSPEHALTVGGGPALSSGYGTPLLRTFLAFSYTPSSSRAPRDSDNDGIADKDDQCPKEAEDMDGFEDANGCPDPDNDGDSILDASDKCPDQAEDGDGFEDQDGCPDPDNDGDGALDNNDQCPTEKEDRDGFQDEDGCPDPDNDGDGILDASDKCPNEAEDKDGLMDEDGCPETDADRDGIPDEQDKCPLEPETINGNEDDDGCPDAGESKVQVTAEQIVILDKVYFDTNKDTIQRRSHSILRQVASVLKANPQLTKVRIEGHTDDVGNDESNQDLSQRRANAVMAFLIERGIVDARLEAVGYGESKPIADNKTSEGRALNRRVVFAIVEMDGKSVEPVKESTEPGRVVPDELKKADEAAPTTDEKKAE